MIIGSRNLTNYTGSEQTPGESGQDPAGTVIDLYVPFAGSFSFAITDVEMFESTNVDWQTGILTSPGEVVQFYSSSIDWGDGTSETLYGTAEGQSPAVYRHQYTAPGRYTVTIGYEVGHFKAGQSGGMRAVLRSWGAYIRSAYRTFREFTTLTGTLPPWGPRTENTREAFWGCSNLFGKVPEWTDVVKHVDNTYRGCTGLTGNIPRWGKNILTARQTYLSCSGLTGADMTTPWELMPFTIEPNTGDCVAGCADSLRALYYVTWGGTGSVLVTSTFTAFTVSIPSARTLFGLESVTAPSGARIDWGDGNVSLCSEATIHFYASPGIYVVKIDGSATSFKLGTGPNPEAVVSLVRWGNRLYSVDYAFEGAINLGGYLPEWSPSIMSAVRTFGGCAKLGSAVPEWPDSMTNATGTYSGCTSLFGPVPPWGRSMQVAAETYRGCVGLTGMIPEWGPALFDVSNVYDGCSGLDSSWTVEESEMMPEHRIHGHDGSVSGTAPSLAALFDVTWGGTRQCRPLSEDFVFELFIPDSGGTFSLPYVVKSGESGSIDWGDGTITSLEGVETREFSHEYSRGGSYRLCLHDISHFRCHRGSNPEWVVKVVQWGERITDATHMFSDCVNLTEALPENWPQTLTTLDYAFDGCVNLSGEIPAWQTSNVVSAVSAFRGCVGLTGSIPDWGDVIENVSGIYEGCTGFTVSAPAWGASIVNVSRAYTRCTGLTGTVPSWTDAIVDANNVFCGCSSLTGVLPVWGSGLENVSYAFCDCPGISKAWATEDTVLMPSRIILSEGCVSGCSVRVRSLFFPHWGGFRLPPSAYGSASIIELTIPDPKPPYGFDGSFTIRTVTIPRKEGEESEEVPEINWGDGTSSPYTQTSHVYGSPGVYLIAVPEETTRLQVSSGSNYTGNPAYVSGIKQWGASVVDVSNAFVSCVNLKGAIPAWPQSVTKVGGVFSGCSGLSGSIPEWPPNLEIAQGAYYKCSGLRGEIPEWPTRVTDVAYAFFGCSGLRGEIPAWKSYIRFADYTYAGCPGLTCPANAPVEDLMPASMQDYSYCVYGSRQLVPYFYPDWGGERLRPEEYSDPGYTVLAVTIPEGGGQFGVCLLGRRDGFTSVDDICVFWEGDLVGDTGINDTYPSTKIKNCQFPGTFIVRISSYITQFKCSDEYCSPGVTFKLIQWGSHIVNADYAFENCTSLVGDIPPPGESITSMVGTYRNCVNLTGVVDSSQEILMPSRVEYTADCVSGCLDQVRAFFFESWGGLREYIGPEQDKTILVVEVPDDPRIFGFHSFTAADGTVIDWGDGLTTAYHPGDTVVHTYAAGGRYTIKIDNTTSQLRCYGGVNFSFLVGVERIGSNVVDLNNAFRESPVAGTVDLHNAMRLSDMSYAFYGCTDVTAAELPLFAGCALDNLSHAFYGCTSLANFNGWPPNATRLDYAFYGCTSLSGVIPRWPDTVRYATFTYGNCISLTGAWSERPEDLMPRSADRSGNTVRGASETLRRLFYYSWGGLESGDTSGVLGKTVIEVTVPAGGGTFGFSSVTAPGGEMIFWGDGTSSVFPEPEDGSETAKVPIQCITHEYTNTEISKFRVILDEPVVQFSCYGGVNSSWVTGVFRLGHSLVNLENSFRDCVNLRGAIPDLPFTVGTLSSNWTVLETTIVRDNRVESERVETLHPTVDDADRYIDELKATYDTPYTIYPYMPEWPKSAFYDYYDLLYYNTKYHDEEYPDITYPHPENPDAAPRPYVLQILVRVSQRKVVTHVGQGVSGAYRGCKNVYEVDIGEYDYDDIYILMPDFIVRHEDYVKDTSDEIQRLYFPDWGGFRRWDAIVPSYYTSILVVIPSAGTTIRMDFSSTRVNQTTAPSYGSPGYYDRQDLVEWGDGAVDTPGVGVAHEYRSAGRFLITLRYDVTSFKILSGNEYVDRIYKLGPNLTDLQYAFADCFNLGGTIPPLPDALANMNGTFLGCSKLTGSVPAWPPAVSCVDETYKNCVQLTGFVPAWPAGIMTAKSTFENCPSLIGSIPDFPANFTRAESTFYGCSGLTGRIPSWPDSVSYIDSVYFGCTGLTESIPPWPNNDKLVYVARAYKNCSGLTGEVPDWHYSITYANEVYYGCSGLSGRLPLWAPSVLFMERTFYGCSGLSGVSTLEPSRLMPPTARSFRDCVAGTSLAVRRHFDFSWGGGVAVPETGMTVLEVTIPIGDFGFGFESVSSTVATEIDWGDGTKSINWDCAHWYSAPGTYIIKLGTAIRHFQCYGGINPQYVTKLVCWGLNITSARDTFRGCTNLTGDLPAWGERINDTQDTFNGCTGLTCGIPEWGGKITNANGTYSGCANITGEFPAWGKNIASAAYTYAGCRNVTASSIPAWRDSLVTALGTYQNCTGVTATSIPVWGSSTTNVAYCYENVSSLRFLWANNLEDFDIMPGRITISQNCVSGTDESLSTHFYEAWGGTRPEVQLSSYVQDGLSMMWDGRDKSGYGINNLDAFVWKDLVGGHDAVPMYKNLRPKWDMAAAKVYDENTSFHALIPITSPFIQSLTENPSFTVEICLSSLDLWSQNPNSYLTNSRDIIFSIEGWNSIYNRYTRRFLAVCCLDAGHHNFAFDAYAARSPEINALTPRISPYTSASYSINAGTVSFAVEVSGSRIHRYGYWNGNIAYNGLAYTKDFDSSFIPGHEISAGETHWDLSIGANISRCTLPADGSSYIQTLPVLSSRIHCVRLYNRKLSSYEIAVNRNLDVSRFSI